MTLASELRNANLRALLSLGLVSLEWLENPKNRTLEIMDLLNFEYRW